MELTNIAYQLVNINGENYNMNMRGPFLGKGLLLGIKIIQYAK